MAEDSASLELARHLMAEEAMASYQHHVQLLQHVDDADYRAIRDALQEDEQHELAEAVDEGSISYDGLLELGEQIGDVKSERWAMVAQNEIDKLETLMAKALPATDDDSTVKCLICQCEYEPTETLRRLPCGHCFHQSCVDQWLSEKDVCPYCRKPITDAGM